MSEARPKTSSGLEQNVAGLLCYILGWVTGILFLIIEKENKFVRFHAFQSVATYVVFFVLYIVFLFIPVIGFVIDIILGIVMFILWLVLMFKAYQGRTFKLPIVGNFAEKQANQTPKTV
jgi:uncharacterized membrane protein